MRYIVVVCTCISFLLSGCFEDHPEKRTFVKSVMLNEGARVDWYVYSKINSFAPDYLRINSIDSPTFFKSFYLSEISFETDTLFISLYHDGYELDESKLPGIKVVIDTLGQNWNNATSRIGRLRRRGVNMEAPHFTDTYCEKGECEWRP